MAQDIRDLFKKNASGQHELPKGHRERFAGLLEKELPKEHQKKSYLFWKVAAVVLVLFGVGFGIFLKQDPSVSTEDGFADTQTVDKKEPQLTLGDISPDLKKVENYYLANINLELADINISEANQKLLDGYMNRLGELNDAYKELTLELNEVGPNEQTINALINNLQFRLQLLYRLKEKIKELKDNTNEEFTTQNV
ncbi:hypothetical protein HX109_02295 [Galbibacter sp. BG1]|uniref:hypothetical protein n=1 Tax=Galbibacter sp. BG1 TaxID=1170699 RepID=UPI0015BF9C96|nr:hypothetical protein [Galbibacter sp. BG1]QLE00445.1 hypothetical protein HX109_02295 [Galbibacter sp. BG1]